MEEYEAALAAGSRGYGDHPGVKDWVSVETNPTAPYVWGDFIRDRRPSLRLAVARPTRMGANAVGPTAAVLATRLNPWCLAMVGVCAGNPGAIGLGDVIVAEMTYAYDEGRNSEAGFEGDHRQIPLNDVWVRAAQDLSIEDLPSYRDATDADTENWILERLLAGEDPRKHPASARYLPRGRWRSQLATLTSKGLIAALGAELELTQSGRLYIEEHIANDIDGPQQIPFSVHVGPIASGNIVVKDGITWRKLAQWGVRSALGLEMEAASIAQIAHRLGVPNWVVVKGVMDHADPGKSDRIKSFAARASAEVMLKLVASQIDNRHDHETKPKDLVLYSQTEVRESSDKDSPSPTKWAFGGRNAKDHFHRRSHGLRGGMFSGDFFRGREAALSTATKLLNRGLGRPIVITGQPGAGKSAVLGRVALKTQNLQYIDGFIFHAQGASSHQFLKQLSSALNRPNIDAMDELHEYMSSALNRPYVVMVDALDECVSRSETYALAESICQISRHPQLRVVVATRPLAASGRFDRGGLLASLEIYGADTEALIDLDSERYRDQSAIANFSESILRQDSIASPGPEGAAWETYRNATKLARLLAEAIALKAGDNFLVAAISASTLSCQEAVVDPTAPGFDMSQLPASVGEALEKYLDTLSPETRATVHSMLVSLRFAFDDGFNVDTWLGVSQALGYSLDRAHIEQFRTTPVADFLIETKAEFDNGVTRLYHRSLIEQLSVGSPPGDASRVLSFFHARVDSAGGWTSADEYSKSTILRYASLAGELSTHLLNRDILASARFGHLGATIENYESEPLPPFTKFLAEESEELDCMGERDRISLLYFASSIRQWVDLKEAIERPDLPITIKWTANLAREHGRIRSGSDRIQAIASGLLGHQQVIAVGFEDGTVRLWNSNGSPVLSPLSVSGSPITAVTVGELGGRTSVAAGTAAGDVMAWSSSGQRILPEISAAGPIASLRFSGYGGGLLFVAVGDVGTLGIDARGNVIHEDRMNVPTCSLGLVGNSVYAAYGFRKSVLLKNLATDSFETVKKFSDSRKLLIHCGSIGGRAWALTSSVDGVVETWTRDKSRAIDSQELSLTEPPATAMTFLYGSDQTLIAVADQRRTIRINSLNGTIVDELVGHEGKVHALQTPCFGEPSLLASGGIDGVIRLWDIRNIANESLRNSVCTSVAWSEVRSHPEELLVSYSEDHELRLWNCGVLVGHWQTQLMRKVTRLAALFDDGSIHVTLFGKGLDGRTHFSIWCINPDSGEAVMSVGPTRYLGTPNSVSMSKVGSVVYPIFSNKKGVTVIDPVSRSKIVWSPHTSKLTCMCVIGRAGSDEVIVGFADGSIYRMQFSATDLNDLSNESLVDELSSSITGLAVVDHPSESSYICCTTKSGVACVYKLSSVEGGELVFETSTQYRKFANRPSFRMSFLEQHGWTAVSLGQDSRELVVLSNNCADHEILRLPERAMACAIRADTVTYMASTSLGSFRVVPDNFRSMLHTTETDRPIGTGLLVGGTSKPLTRASRKKIEALIAAGEFDLAFNSLTRKNYIRSHDANCLAADCAIVSRKSGLIREALAILASSQDIDLGSTITRRVVLTLLSDGSLSSLDMPWSEMNGRFGALLKEFCSLFDRDLETEYSVYHSFFSNSDGEQELFLEKLFCLMASVRYLAVIRRISVSRGLSFIEARQDVSRAYGQWFDGDRKAALTFLASSMVMSDSENLIASVLLPYQWLSLIELLDDIADYEYDARVELFARLCSSLAGSPPRHISNFGHWALHSRVAADALRAWALSRPVGE